MHEILIIIVNVSLGHSKLEEIFYMKSIYSHRSLVNVISFMEERMVGVGEKNDLDC